ncbi:MAG: gas vesicle protein GvpO [Pseudomonadota bacterium]
MEQPKQDAFKDPKAKGKALSMPDAIAKARLAMGAITSAPVDAVRSCTRGENDVWTATVEVIESPARLGDNDLISAYEMKIDGGGDLLEFQRVGRYHREDAAGA